MTASGISDKNEKVYSKTLLHMAGKEALGIYDTFSWEKDVNDWKVSINMCGQVQILLQSLKKCHMGEPRL